MRTDWTRCQAFARQILPLRFAFQTRPFGDGSLFAKTLKKMLTDEPVVQFQAR